MEQTDGKCRVASKAELEGYIQEKHRWDALSSKVSEIEAGVYKLEKILEKTLDKRLQQDLNRI